MQSLAEEPARSASQTCVRVPHQRSVQQLPPSSPEESPVIDHGRNKDTATALFSSAPAWGPARADTEPGEGNRTTHSDAEASPPHF